MYKVVNSLSLKLMSDCVKLNDLTVYNTRNSYTFYSWPVCQSYIVHNHSLTWDRRSGKLCQLIWKTFKYSHLSKKPLNSGSHMLIHVDFVEPTSTRLVSFNLWMQNQCLSSCFLFLSRDIYFLTFCAYVVRTLFIAVIFILLYFCYLG